MSLPSDSNLNKNDYELVVVKINCTEILPPIQAQGFPSSGPTAHFEWSECDEKFCPSKSFSKILWTENVEVQLEGSGFGPLSQD